MNRQFVYSGGIPQDVDLLKPQKNAMLGLSGLTESLMGQGTFMNGLACLPGFGLQVVIAPGQLYSLLQVDPTAYGSITADTTHTVMKQGINPDITGLTVTAPTTAGYSKCTLIQGRLIETDGDSAVLPYYNASNPTVAWNGVANGGVAQNTSRKVLIDIQAKAGVQALTGTQVAPTADSGYVGMYVITLAYGALAVVQSNITAHANIPITNQVWNKANNSMTGFVGFYGAKTPPAGYLVCDGSTLNKTDFSELWGKIGGTWGSTTLTFNVPDLRGEFLRGWDNGRGVDGRTFIGAALTISQTIINFDNSLGDVIPGMVVYSAGYSAGTTVLSTTTNSATLSTGALASGNYTVNICRAFGVLQYDSLKSHAHDTGIYIQGGYGDNNWSPNIPYYGASGHQTGMSGGNESRPRNVALLPCIKY